MTGVTLEAAASASRLLEALLVAQNELVMLGLYDEASRVLEIRKEVASKDITALPTHGVWEVREALNNET